MFEVATSLTELIPNLLDPLTYVLGILGNVYGYRKMAQSFSAPADESPLQVRIGLARPGQVPRYRIENSEAEVVGVFDGRNHTVVKAEEVRRDLWGDRPVPATDVENLAVVLRWLGTVGNVDPVPPDTN
jgi:hypothetical protein